MTKDDVIRMAREASNNCPDALLEDDNDLAMLYLDELERFAALVAAAEREACAKVCDQFIDAMKEVLPVEQLRETNPYIAFYKANAATVIQDAIRARGQSCNQ